MKDDTWIWIALGVLVLGAGGYGVWQVTRGLRNNNPGNILYSTSNTWQGQTGQDSAGFIIFDTSTDGIRALALLLLNYQNLYGLNTVTGIITRWAPPSENDTASYISDVADDMGVDPDQTINLNDQGTLTNLVSAIIKHENGINPYDLATIQSGVAAA